jgi:hypothetical protein
MDYPTIMTNAQAIALCRQWKQRVDRPLYSSRPSIDTRYSDNAGSEKYAAVPDFESQVVEADEFACLSVASQCFQLNSTVVRTAFPMLKIYFDR